MSAYGHHMEREYSAQSMSSPQGSVFIATERASSYSMESGFYMSSFATTIFIASLVTVGLLFITLLIALTVMLQSCERKTHGMVEALKGTYDPSYCHISSLHMELNNLKVDQFPPKCRVVALQYIEGGQYARDLNSTLSMVEDYLSTKYPQHDGLDAVLLDVDDILSSYPKYSNITLQGHDYYDCSDCAEEAKHLKHKLILRLYMKLHANGWPLILLSRKPETQRNTSIEYLATAGYTAWSSLILRSEAELHMDSSDYFATRRAAMQIAGLRIICIMSSRMDALSGPFLGTRFFKLPNPLFHSLEHHVDDVHTPK